MDEPKIWRQIPGNLDWGKYRVGGGRMRATYRAQRRNIHFRRPTRGNRTPGFRAALAQVLAEHAAAKLQG